MQSPYCENVRRVVCTAPTPHMPARSAPHLHARRLREDVPSGPPRCVAASVLSHQRLGRLPAVLDATLHIGSVGDSASDDAGAAACTTVARAGVFVPGMPPAAARGSTARAGSVPRDPQRIACQATPWMDAPPTAAPHAPRLAAPSMLAAPVMAAPAVAGVACLHACRATHVRRGTRTRRGGRAGARARLRRTQSEA